MPRLPVVLTLLAVLAGGHALARQPVSSPIYYLTTAPELVDGVPVHGALSADSGRNFKDGSYLDVLVMRGEEGDAVELRVTSLAFDTVVTVFAPDGQLLDWNDDDPHGYGTDSALVLSLPVSGTYVVVVSGYGDWDLGPYTATMTRFGGGHAEAATLEPPASIDGVLAPGGRDSYRLLIEEDAVVSVRLASLAFDTFLELYDAEGWFLAENDDALSTTDSELLVRLSAGEYLVVASAYYGYGGGEYVLTVQRYEPEP
jgi:hypothetical protein